MRGNIFYAPYLPHPWNTRNITVEGSQSTSVQRMVNGVSLQSTPFLARRQDENKENGYVSSLPSIHNWAPVLRAFYIPFHGKSCIEVGGRSHDLTILGRDTLVNRAVINAIK